jgi:copper(I)-binding protein
MSPNTLLRAAMACAIATAATLAAAQTKVEDPWVRGTVTGQMATGAFFTLTSNLGGKLVAASSPAAGHVEIHEMAMAGDVMKMREVAGGLPLPAGKPVKLSPGGYHLMLMGLKKPLAAGEVIPLAIVIEGKDGQRSTIDVKAPVRALGDTGAKKP